MPKPKENTETNPRVAFNLSEAMEQELERILEVTDISSKPEVFRRAFTLLRIHVDAARKNQKIYLVDPDEPDEKYIVSLPFNVLRDEK
jgi:hypothetical protein